MTKEQAIKELRICECYSVEPSVEALDMAIKALEQQSSDETIKYLEYNDIDVQKFAEAMKKQPLQVIKPNISDDCVSRQAVLDILSHYAHNFGADNEIKSLPPVTPTHGTCKDCKHWKDSDGVYRRGIGAESKCPINTKEVYEGNFYCKWFEKRGSENGSN